MRHPKSRVTTHFLNILLSNNLKDISNSFQKQQPTITNKPSASWIDGNGLNRAEHHGNYAILGDTFLNTKNTYT